jgi:uncharacterized OB-fold protein
MADGIPPPLPTPDDTSRFFWEGAARGELLIQRCADCSRFVHPPRPVCPECLSTDLAPERVSGRATLYTWTVAEQAFHPWFTAQLPYVYATVELAEQAGLRLITNVVDCPHEELRAGMDLEVSFAALTDTVTIPQFRPPATR